MSAPVSEELLDVVDHQNKVIDIRPRGEVHRLGLVHRSVHILVFSSTGEVFLQKRSTSKDSNPGLWDSSAAGHLNSVEGYDACAARELTEELGVDGQGQLDRLFLLPASPVTAMEHCAVYRHINNGPFVLQADEIDEGEWFTASALDQRVAGHDPTLTTIFRLIWQTFRVGNTDDLAGAGQSGDDI